MEQLPTSFALAAVVLLGAVAVARRFDRRSAVLDAVAGAGALALVAAAAATFPGDALTAVGIMAVVIGLLGALVVACAALEALPRLIRDRAARSSTSSPSPAPRPQPRPLADASRRGAAARP